MNNDDINYYANLNNKNFKEKISKTSCGWRGKNIIRRNAIIKLYNEGKDIEQFRGDSSVINECIEELIKNS
jgi:epoxyqueuosine reductase QueG